VHSTRRKQQDCVGDRELGRDTDLLFGVFADPERRDGRGAQPSRKLVEEGTQIAVRGVRGKCLEAGDGTPIITVAGEIDLYRIPALTQALESAPGTARVVVDLRDVTFLDSTTLALLVREHRRLKRPVAN
jgi:STAS domain